MVPVWAPRRCDWTQEQMCVSSALFRGLSQIVSRRCLVFQILAMLCRIGVELLVCSSPCKVVPKVCETVCLIWLVTRSYATSTGDVGDWFRACSAPLFSPMKCAALLWQLLSQTLWWGQVDSLRCRMWSVLRRRRCRLNRWTSVDRRQWQVPRSTATLSNRQRYRQESLAKR